jgi:enamine deaminase RidA (YjgF/YER057c/UK114 family)
MNTTFQRLTKVVHCNVHHRSPLIGQIQQSQVQHRCIHIEKRLQELGIVLPMAPTPKANYNIVCHANGRMLYISGHLPLMLDGILMTGRIGPDTGGESIPHGYEAARYAGLNIISTLKSQLGDLDRVEKIVKVCISCNTVVASSVL